MSPSPFRKGFSNGYIKALSLSITLTVRLILIKLQQLILSFEVVNF